MSILVSRCVDKAKEEIQIIITNGTILLVIAVIYYCFSKKQYNIPGAIGILYLFPVLNFTMFSMKRVSLIQC